MSGGSDDQTTISEPWSGQAPYLENVFGQAQDAYYSGGPQYFPGQTAVPFSPQTEQAFDMTTQRAMGGAPYEQAYGNYINQSLQQPGVDLSGGAAGATQALGGIAPGQGLIAQGAQNPYAGLGGAQQFAQGGSEPYSQALQGATQYGGLGEAQQFAGGPAGSLGASNQYVQDVLNQSPTLGQSISGVSGTMDPAAQAQLSQTAGGDYLGSNPYLDEAFQSAAQGVTQQFEESVLPGIAGQFGQAGRTGSGIHALATGRASGELSDTLGQMASNIYAPAYEAERGRQLQAAGQLGQLDLGTAGLGADVYGGEQQRRLGAAGLGGDLYATENQADLARRGMASDLYLGERGLGQQAALGGMGAELGQQQLAGSLYQQGLENQMRGGGMLSDLGMAGAGQLGDYYGMIDRSRATAGAQAPAAQSMDYTNIDRLAGVGAQIEDQSGRYLDDLMQRYQYQQQQPYQNLAQYSNLVNQMPGGYGDVTGPDPRGSRTAGAIGGGMSGASMGSSYGPWGALAGGILGAYAGYQ